MDAVESESPSWFAASSMHSANVRDTVAQYSPTASASSRPSPHPAHSPARVTPRRPPPAFTAFSIAVAVPSLAGHARTSVSTFATDTSHDTPSSASRTQHRHRPRRQKPVRMPVRQRRRSPGRSFF